MPKISDAKRDARRRQFLDAALALFSEAGFHQTGMADIVRRSGLSRPARSTCTSPPAFESSPEGRPSSDRRALHDHEARALKIPDEPLGDDRRHELASVIHALPFLEAPRGDRTGERMAA